MGGEGGEQVVVTCESTATIKNGRRWVPDFGDHGEICKVGFGPSDNKLSPS
jgi:hypothetical protein